VAVIFEGRHQLQEKQSLPLVKLESRTDEIKYYKLDVAGNSLLSTVYCHTALAGSSVTVDYYDFTTGFEFNEENPLRSHIPVTSGPDFNKILVTHAHDKIVMRVTVVGTVEFSVYGTVVSNSASDLDSALVQEAQIVQLLLDKAIPIAGYDELNGLWRLLRTDDTGALYVISEIEGVKNPTIANETILLANTEYEYSLPLNTKRFFMQNRDNGLVKVAYEMNESGTQYVTIFPGGVLTELGIKKLDQLKIYFQSTKSNQTLEIMSWI